jgi:hypothetical protein
MPLPLLPDNESAVTLAVGAIGCAVADVQAWYVSTPITTGQRLIDWQLSGDPHSESSHPMHPNRLREKVIGPNIRAATAVVGRLRQEGKTVIDPTRLEVLGWTQHDYLACWAEVIRRYVTSVVFTDRWWQSDGSSYEFLVAVQSGKNLFGEDLRALEPHEGLRLLVNQLSGSSGRASSLRSEIVQALQASLGG